MNSFFLHIFIVAPVCQYFLQSGQFSRFRGLLYSIAFLVALAIGTEYQTWSERPLNLYQILDVDVTASSSELHKANLQMSKKFHPDKNPSPDAQARFTEIASAYEILSNQEDRYLYDRYGLEGVKTGRRNASSKNGENNLIVQTIMFYVVWAVLTFLLTIGKSSADGRTWAFTGLVLLAVLEFNMVLSNFDFFQTIFRRMTIRDKLDLLHAMYPGFMNGCRILSQFTYVDLEEQTRQMLIMLLKTNTEIINITGQIATAIDKKGAGGASGSGTTGNLKTKEQSLLNPDGTGTEVIDENNVDESMGPARRIQRAKLENQKQAKAFAEEQKKKMAIPSWAVMVGLYILFNYVLR